MHLPTNFNDLVTEAQQHALYPKLIRQLNKDLALANVDLEFDEDVLPSSLKLILNETLFHLIEDRFMDYLNLLYRVDVPEEKVKQLDDNSPVELAEQITFLVLLREWQKVWYKNKIS